jgi:DNA-3-methyladenine glycosylase II
VPAYWDEACRHLARRDRVMKKLIPRFGDARLHQPRRRLHHAGALHRRPADLGQGGAVGVGSLCAAGRRHPPPLAPGRAGLDVPALREAGLSARKAEYLLDLSRHFAEGRVHVANWQQMDDEAIIAELVAIRGIGRWTAEMFLIFHLMRPNVLPLDDLGLIKGISVNYFSGEPVSRAEAREVGEAWAPFRSVATWYIWRSLDPLPVDY